MKWNIRTDVLGILGGGQLGRMLALAAANLGVRIKILAPGGQSEPAGIAAQVITGKFTDAEDIANFEAQVSLSTVEIEHVNATTLTKVQPSASTIAIIQDKFAQKEHFQKNGVAIGEFCNISNEIELLEAALRFDYPFMLKSKRDAYDGKGNYVVRGPDDIDTGVKKLGGYDHGLYAEKWQDFAKELSVMVVRSIDGTIATYPVTHTIQKDSICYVTETPAQIPEAARLAAENLAKQAVAALDGAGVFGVEMFLTRDGEVLLNEVAPRVHNSGHYTIDAANTSQFENHIRAITGMPLGSTDLKVCHSIMLNILGEENSSAGQAIADALMDRAYATPGCSVHWYNKSGDVRKGRKLGHVNIVGESLEEVRERLGMLDPDALNCLANTKPNPQVGIVMGSDSDLATMIEAAKFLDSMGVAYEVRIVSAHRTPEWLEEYATSARRRGLKAIIAGAGGAAHLPGVMAALTPIPVIGVPVVPSSAIKKDGEDALYSILQMPAGIPVATMAIGNAKNAGIFAAQILAASNRRLYLKLVQFKEQLRQEVMAKDAKLQALGWQDYLKAMNSKPATVVQANGQKPANLLQFGTLAPRPYFNNTALIAKSDTRTRLYVASGKVKANPHVNESLVAALKEFNIDKMYAIAVGKVRDCYILNDIMVLVTTDRLTAFDRPVANIPCKGAVLNLVADYWFKATAHIMQNHVLAVPHPNVTIAKRVTPFKVEIVVREYLTGSTATSIKTLYEKGERNFGGIVFPDGMKAHQKLPRVILTPTTKSDEHDAPITAEEIVSSGLMSQAQWDECSTKALELFAFARDQVAERGLILVDTKMEMGVDENGKIIVIDELFTPDSSRYWLADSYDAQAIAKGEGKPPKNIDKEFIRVWINENCDPYNSDIPTIPEHLILELGRRYVQLYELITGLEFDFSSAKNPIPQLLVQGLKDLAKSTAAPSLVI
jgi:phosphoribosylaminoimidazole carboxylase